MAEKSRIVIDVAQRCESTNNFSLAAILRATAAFDLKDEGAAHGRVREQITAGLDDALAAVQSKSVAGTPNQRELLRRVEKFHAINSDHRIMGNDRDKFIDWIVGY